MNEKLRNIITVALAALFILGFSLWGLIAPDKELSLSERRKLAQFPEISWKSVKDGSFMSSFETYTLDQFPLRDEFRTLKSVTSLYAMGRLDNNDIYISNGFASKLEYPLNALSVKYAASRFEYVYDRYLKDNGSKVYLSVVPDKNYFMAESGGYPYLDYAELVSSLRDQVSFAEYIDIFPLLELDDYYKTDTHWRQEEIIDVARKLASGMGVELKAEYTKKDVGVPFYGVYYGQSALPLPAEKIYCMESDVFSGCTVFDFETNKEMSIYEMDKADGNDPYELFLGGSKSLIQIDNPNATTDKELIIFRDSFGSSLAPLLVEGYKTITVVDIRYISPVILGNLVEFHGQDVLFIYSTLVLNNSVTIK